MSSVTSIQRHQPCNQNRLVIAALIVSILLHGLVLSTSLGPRVATLSSHQVDLSSPLIITLQPSAMFRSLSSKNAVEDHQVKSMAPLTTQAQQNQVSRHTNTRSASNHDSISEKSDTLASEHSSNQSPLIDIDAAHETARKFARESAGSFRQHVRPDTLALEKETELGMSIAKAARPDCRSAHSNKGLLAIPFLIKDAVTDSGCKW